jgi:hypothetical protein
MGRAYSASAIANTEIVEMLDKLADQSSEPSIYQSVMFEIGRHLGNEVLQHLKGNCESVYLACTAEDADYLAKGILDSLEEEIANISFACFWNQRFSPFDIEDLTVAPILKKYQEPANGHIDYLVIIKSIISGACVVRTNLTDLIEKISPERILIVAPVIYENADRKLRDEFTESISSKFEFFYYAKDTDRDAQGNVFPGVGGEVYKRLGFQNQDDKNRFIPELVKARRARILGSAANSYEPSAV